MSIFNVCSASKAGSKHNHNEEENQDARAILRREERVCLALCDGAGSHRHSKKGAELVSRLAVTFLANLDWSRPFAEEAKRFLADVRTAVIEYAESMSLPPREFGCTMLAVAVSRGGMKAVQVGDGFIVCQESPEAEYTLLFPPAKGEYANETVFVASEEAADKAQTHETGNPPFFVCLSSDGVDRQAIRFADLKPHPPFFDYLIKIMRVGNDADGILEKFLAMDSLDQVTDDDRTLVLAMRQEK